MPKKTTKKTVKKTAKAAEEPQPEINIGLVGHVDHGKTTLVQALSGKWADTHSEEMKRGITIRLGYADVSIFKCKGKKGPESYAISEDQCEGDAELLRRISLVDAPGHESLMATMLCGAAIMDGAILMISATEECPQPQTREHVQALEIMGINNIIVVQNKIDLVPEEKAKENYDQIKEFLKNTPFKDSPVIPMSAKHSINMDVLIETIEELFPTPERDITKTPLMFIARSFDINKPGSTPDKMVGGVLGGSVQQGVLKADEEIEIAPGYQTEERNQKVWKPIKTKVTSVVTGGKSVEQIHPGGSVALMTELDPSIVKSDQLVGNIISVPGKTPPIWSEIKLETKLLDRAVGAKDALVVDPIKLKEILMLNVNAAATVGVVTELGKNTIKCTLKRPVCAEKGARVTMSRMLGQRWRLIGYGLIQ